MKRFNQFLEEKGIFKFYYGVLILVVVVITTQLYSCTENSRVRNFGGKMEVQIPQNEKLINITWKETQMWVLTEDTITKQFHFREHSAFGIWEGEIIIKK